MDSHTLAYLAGAMDSDGFFGIKRSTYHIRVRGDATQPSYSERMGLKQVTPQVPSLLKETFGGMLRTDPGQTQNSKSFWTWQATNKVASDAVTALLPYLRIKVAQANLLLEIRRSKDSKSFSQISYWFAKENPDWRDLPMATFPDAARMLGYKGVEMVPQALKNGSILALPWKNDGTIRKRVPMLLIEMVREEMNRSKDGRARCKPRQLIAWRHALYDECRQLNRIGTGLHPITERTGIYTQK